MFPHPPSTFEFFLSFAISVLMAFICASIAEKKGRNTTAWFFWGLMFSFLALIVLFFLPSLNDETAGAIGPNEDAQAASDVDILSKFPEPSEVEQKLWYYLDTDYQQMGPVSTIALKQLWDTGLLDVNSLVWSEGMEEWKKVGELPKLNDVLAQDRPVED